MKPLQVVCRSTIRATPLQIAALILDLDRWPEFRGYGPIPGIERASFETRTLDVVGTRIHVTNCDGSSHIEEVTQWQTEHRLQLTMKEFSAPLSRLASSFIETWELEQHGDITHVTRTIEMNPKSISAWPILWFISTFLKQAISRHLTQINGMS